MNVNVACPLKKLRYAVVGPQSSAADGSSGVPHEEAYGRGRLTTTLVRPWAAPAIASVSRSSTAIAWAVARSPWYHHTLVSASAKKGQVAAKDSSTLEASRKAYRTWMLAGRAALRTASSNRTPPSRWWTPARDGDMLARRG